MTLRESNKYHIKEVLEDATGLWSIGLFGTLVGHNEGHTIGEYKAMFFEILKALLDDGTIRFCRPDDPLGKVYPYWEADSDTIVQYLYDRWPAHAEDEDDSDLNFYFYEVPAVMWRDDEGNYYGS